MSADRYTLTEGDAVVLLRELADASVSAVITDLPYSSGGFTRGDRASAPSRKYPRTGYGGSRIADFAGDNRDQRGYAYWSHLWLSECARVLEPGGFAAVFTDWRQLPTTTDVFQGAGLVWRGIAVWAKPAARPQLGRPAASCEFVVWGTRGPRPIEGEVLPGHWEEAAPTPGEREHMTEKPLSVLRSLVQTAPPGGLVLDPFAGSGTTGVATLVEGRRFLGFELDPYYAEVARRRLEEADRGFGRALAGQSDLFAPAPAEEEV